MKVIRIIRMTLWRLYLCTIKIMEEMDISHNGGCIGTVPGSLRWWLARTEDGGWQLLTWGY